MKRALVLLFLATGLCVYAQDQKPAEPKQPGPAPAVRVFTIKPGNLYRIRDAVRLVAGGVNVTSDEGSNTIVVRTMPEYMPAVEQIVKQLDDMNLPQHNVELTFYILSASHEPGAEGAPLPAGLEPVVNQLKSVFAFKSFRLLDTAFLRSRSNADTSVDGAMSFAKDLPGQYEIHLRPSLSTDTKPPTIHLDKLFFSVKVPRGGLFYYVGLNGTADFKEGQKVVIGKTGLEGGQSALILVATGKVVD